MKRLLASLLLGSLSLLTFTVYAGTLEEIKKSGTLRVCLEPAYIPFEMIDTQGAMIGFDPDLAALMAKELKVKPKFISTAWDDIIPALIDNKCDIIMSGMTITEDRHQKIDFSNAYISIGQTVLLRKGLASKVKSYKDLNDPKYKVVSKLETTGEAAVKQYIPNASYSSLKDEQEAVMAVVDGRADAFIYDSPYNAVAFGRYGAGKLVFLDEPFTMEHLGWGVRKGDPGWVEWLNSFLKKVTQDGTKYKLYRKWFKNTDWLKDVKQ